MTLCAAMLAAVLVGLLLPVRQATTLRVMIASTSTPAQAPLARVPAAVALSGGSLFLTDVANGELLAVDLATGARQVVASDLPGARGLVADRAGSLYVAVSSRHQVVKVTPGGPVTVVAGTGARGFAGDGGPAPAARLDTPDAVALGPDGSLYIADTRNNRVRRVDQAGIIRTVAGSGLVTAVGGSGGFGFSGDGGPATLAQLAGPEALAVGSDGELYIADTDNDRVRMVDATGVIRTLAGTGREGLAGDGGPALNADLAAPVGLALGAADALFVAERVNHTVRQVTRGGLLVRIAGNGRRGPELDDPAGLAVDARGRLYISDSGHQRVLLVADDGEATAWAA